SPLKVSVNVDLPARPEAPVESAVYFVVSELLTNASRHGGGRHVAVDISRRGPALRITVTDDGHGGADPSRGSGLRGIERRVAAFDGVLTIHSPEGGPTIATVDIPHAFAGQVPRRTRLPAWKYALMVLCWGMGWLPLFPQRLVAAAFKIYGADEQSWFLALYLPEALQWPTIISMLALGMAMLIIAQGLAQQAEQLKSEVNV
ncbi:sensor histidine kinase, partial [Sphaerisporangium rhizosphaerae]